MWASGFWATNFWAQGFWFGDEESPENNFDDLPIIRRKRKKPARENDEALILFVL